MIEVDDRPGIFECPGGFAFGVYIKGLQVVVDGFSPMSTCPVAKSTLQVGFVVVRLGGDESVEGYDGLLGGKIAYLLKCEHSGGVGIIWR